MAKRPRVDAHAKQDRYIIDDAESATPWAGSTDVSALTTAVNHREGSKAISFAKSGTTQSFGQISKTLDSDSPITLAEYYDGKLTYWINLSSLTDIASVQLLVGTDASNHAVFQTADTALTTGWNKITHVVTSPTSLQGNGANWNSIGYISIKVNFDAVGNTLAAILVDSIAALYEINIDVETINLSGTGLATAANQNTLNTAIAAAASGSGPLAVKNSDGTNVGSVISTTVTGSANGAGQFEVTAIDVSSYKTLSLQRTGTYNLTATFECSNDNVNWVLCPLQNVASVPLGENTSVSGSGQAMYSIAINFKYFRSRISAYTSGTVNTTLVLSTLPAQMPTTQTFTQKDGDWSFGPVPETTILTSAARTTTQTGADQTNNNGRGLKVVLDMTNVAAGPDVTLTIDAKDPTSGKYYNLLTGASVTTVSTNVYTVYPGLTPVANKTVSDVLPRTWRVVVTANNANSATYSVGMSYLT